MLYTHELTQHGMDTRNDAQRCVRGTWPTGLGVQRHHGERAPAIGGRPGRSRARRVESVDRVELVSGDADEDRADER